MTANTNPLAALRMALVVISGLVGVAPAQAANLPGMGQLSGKVSVAKPVGQLSVYALNTDKNVGYMVYVVNGQYRATDLFPGHYDVTLRGTAGQLNWSLPQQTVKVDVAANQTATADFAMHETTLPPTYVGGMVYPNAKIEPFEKVFPPGKGRDVMERICFGCHTEQLYAYNVDRIYADGHPLHDKDGWAITVDRMAHGEAFSTPGKPSNFDGALLSEADRDAVVDYLAKNFGADAPPRAVQQDTQPALDEAALAKAEFVEYRFPNKPGEDDRFVHTPDLDGKGNVWIMDRGGASLVFIDPVTAQVIDHKGHGGGENLVVDIDDTIWYGGLRHYDPKIDKHDEYKFEGGKNGRNISVSTMAIDSHGDIWLSMLGAGSMAKYDRKTDSLKWWDVPVSRCRPYGLTLDHNDKVWFACYHASSIVSFDPKTEQFRNYQVTPEKPTNIRRVGIDSKNFAWTATWGSPGFHPALFRIDPKTGESERFNIDIANSNPYDSEVDGADNVWVATDNHILKFDPGTKKFTFFPTPERTDIPKLTITRDGAIWYGPRNAGQSGGYGGAAGVLYPDKDNIKTFAAYYGPRDARFRKTLYHGPGTPVTGTVKFQSAVPQNPGAYAAAVGGPATPTVTNPGATQVIEGGAAHE